MMTLPDTDRFIVLTGGPGSGKSTLIQALQQQGYAATEEAGRAIIRDQVAIDGPALPWNDPAAFAELMLCWELRSWRGAQDQPGPVFFDRGVVDLVGYHRLMNLPVPSHLDQAARQFRYRRLVFVAPHWPAIFGQDAERKQSPDEAERTCRAMIEAWPEYGYELVFLPFAPVEDRVRFVLERLEQ